MKSSCFNCGYPLKGYENLCPECGQRLRDDEPYFYDSLEHNHFIENDYSENQNSIVETKHSSNREGYENISHGFKTLYINQREISSKKRDRSLFSLKNIIFITIIAILILAVAKNPTKEESKILVKSMIIEKIDNVLRENMLDKESKGLDALGAFFGIAFSHSIYDFLVNTEVNDYFLFSTFSAAIPVDNQPKILASGIILFGKAFPLKSDLKNKENLKRFLETKY